MLQEQYLTAVVEGTNTDDVLSLLKAGLDMYLKWKTEGYLVLRKSCTQCSLGIKGVSKGE
jgi:hypothetical protein